MAEIIRIPDGNAFLLRVTGQIRTGDYTEDADFSVVTHMGVNFVRRGRIAQTFGLDSLGRIVIENSGNLAQGVYGVELYGYYHGEPWRNYQKNVFQIVNENANSDPGSDNENVLTYDVTFDVTFGGDGISAAFVEATVATHNGDQESHPDLREEIEEKVSDVKVGNTSVVEGGVAFIDLSGKQDVIDDLADIRSGAEAGGTAYQKPGTGIPESDMSDAVKAKLAKAESALQEHQDISGKQDVIQDLSTIRSGAAAGGTAYQKPGTGIPASDLSSEVQDMIENGGKTKSVSVNGGTPVTPDANGLVDLTIEQTNVTIGTVTTGAAGSNAEVNNSGTGTAPVLDFVIPQGQTGQTGPQGPMGESVIVGQGDLPLAHVLGQSNTKAISQKGFTDALLAEIYSGNYSEKLLEQYFTISTNKFAYVSRQSGYYNNDGTIHESSSYYYSNLFPIKPSCQYIGGNVTALNVALFDENRIFQRVINGKIAFTTASNEVYASIESNAQSFKTIMLNEGATLLTLEPFYIYINKDVIDPDLVGLATEIEEESSRATNAEATIRNTAESSKKGVNYMLRETTNLADKSSFIRHKSFDKKTGVMANDTSNVSAIEDYLPINPSTTYQLGYVLEFVEYAEDKSFVKWTGYYSGGFAHRAITTSATTKYIRFVFQDAYPNVQINEGSTLLPYELYFEGYRLCDDFKTQVRDTLNFEVSPYFHGPYDIRKSDFQQWYEGKQNGYSTFNANTTYADIIAAFDTLMSADSGYITKNSLGIAAGTDSGGNNYTIYEYVLKPKRYGASLNQKKVPKILIDGCIHGFEKNSTYGLYYFVKDIIENWDKNDALKAIRCHTEIRIIPCVNPWGFDNNIRNNANGINLNRNFYCNNWSPSTEGANASGLEPFDQPEAAIVRDWILANKTDCLCYINCHTDGMYYANGYNNMSHWMVSSDRNDTYFNRLYNVGVRHIEEQTFMWTKLVDSIGPGTNTFCGEINTEASETTTSGNAEQWCCAHNDLLAITLEGANGLSVNDTTIYGVLTPISKKISSENIGNAIIQILYEYADN